MGTTSSTTMQNLGEIVQCAPAVGAKIWCLYVCFFVMLWGRHAVHSRGYTLSRFVSLFMGRFWCRFSAFFQEGIALLDGIDSSHFIARWRHNFREIAVQNCEKFKNWRKILCAPLRIDILDFRTNPPHCFGARNVDVHLYKKFSTLCYIAPAAIVKFRIGSPKMARNKQVCVHQKSYRK